MSSITNDMSSLAVSAGAAAMENAQAANTETLPAKLAKTKEHPFTFHKIRHDSQDLKDMKQGEICTFIVKKYNEKSRRGEPQAEEFTPAKDFNEWSVAFGFEVKLYAKQTKRSLKVLERLRQPRDTDEAGLHAKLSLLIFFLSTNDKTCIYAATTAAAWNILRKYRDTDFPNMMAARLLNLHGYDRVTYQDLLGCDRRVDKVFKAPQIPNPLKFGRVVLNYYAKIRNNSSIYWLETEDFNLRNSRDGSGKPITVFVGVASLKICTEMPLQFVPRVVEYFHTSMTPHLKFFEHSCNENVRVVEKLSGVYNRSLKTVETNLWETLNNSLLLQAKMCDPNLDICLPFDNEFGEATSFDVAWPGGQTKVVYPPLTMTKILDGARPSLLNVEDMKKTTVSFDTWHNEDPKAKQEFLLKYIQGQLLFENKMYWHFNSIWYQIKGDYIRMLQDEFIVLLKDHLIDMNDIKYQLDLPWPSKVDKSEARIKKQQAAPANSKVKLDTEYELYNSKYANHHPDFVVADRVTAENIEICDILRYCEDTKTFILYHVKQGFNQKTREACYQILNSAKFITGMLGANSDSSNFVLETYREKLTIIYEKTNKQENLPVLYDSSLFKKALLNSTIVYALSDDRLLSDEINLKTCVRAENICHEYGEDDRQSICEKLKELGYLDDSGNLIYLPPQDSFVANFTIIKQRKDRVELHQLLKQEFMTKFPSIISKTDLISTRDALAEVGFRGGRFKICQISNSKVLDFNKHPKPN